MRQAIGLREQIYSYSYIDDDETKDWGGDRKPKGCAWVQALRFLFWGEDTSISFREVRLGQGRLWPFRLVAFTKG